MRAISGANGRRNRRKKTWFLYVPKEEKKTQLFLRLFAILLCAVVLVVALCHVIGYVKDLVTSRQLTEELRQMYTVPEETPQPENTEVPAASLAQPEVTEAPVLSVSAPATKKPAILESKHYPNNFKAEVQYDFLLLKLKNPDITGWLKIGTHLDEPVVQRDNEYYLRRDYLGNRNSNGTLFLDQDTEWKTRPYTLMVYGHNMKSGAMFGHLRSYEKYDYLADHAIITFNTAYENGRYVVLAVGTYSLRAGDDNFLNLGRLDSRTVDSREKEIEKLISAAVTTTPVDVQADDQLLLLITCVDDENERRILAARRIRENETEEELMQAIRMKNAE